MPTKIEAKDFITELLTQANCRNVHPSGPNISCQCPFHRPRKNTTAFGISIEKDDELYPYQCFSCHETGNVITLIAHLNKCSYFDARKIFRRRVAFKPITLEVLKSDFRKLKERREKTKKNYTIDLPARFNGKPMMQYFKRRNKIEQHGIMNVGFIVNKYDLYFCDAGRYAKRIIMPIRDQFGRYIYFSNRTVQRTARKNIFPQETDATNFLYGLFEAIGCENVMIVEGQFDVYQLKSFAIKNGIENFGFVAIMGTVMTEERIALFMEFFKRAYLLFDHDEAGLKCEDDSYKMLTDCMETYRITEALYKGKDPANSNGKQLKKVFAYKPPRRVMVPI